jgi:hypothetical protein
VAVGDIAARVGVPADLALEVLPVVRLDVGKNLIDQFCPEPGFQAIVMDEPDATCAFAR